MSTPSRQHHGIPAGGQFAPEAHAEPDVQLDQPVAHTRIIATVHLQDWINDYAVTRESIEFDATRILADMSAEQLASMEDSSDHADELYHEAMQRGLVRHHDGPFDVTVRDALDTALTEDPDVLTKAAAAPPCRPAGQILDNPLTAYEIGARADHDGWVEGLSVLSMDDLIDNDLEGHLELISEKLVGSGLLMEPSAKPVRVDPDGTIVVTIAGDASGIIDGFDEEEQADFEAGRASKSSRTGA